jgi:hypothetical protein
LAFEVFPDAWGFAASLLLGWLEVVAVASRGRRRAAASATPTPERRIATGRK